MVLERARNEDHKTLIIIDFVMRKVSERGRERNTVGTVGCVGGSGLC